MELSHFFGETAPIFMLYFRRNVMKLAENENYFLVKMRLPLSLSR